MWQPDRKRWVIRESENDDEEDKLAGRSAEGDRFCLMSTSLTPRIDSVSPAVRRRE